MSKKGLAVFSGSSPIHKLMQDGQVVLGSGSVAAAVTISGTLDVTSTVTVDASELIVGSGHVYAPETNLSGILAAIKSNINTVSSAGSDNSAALTNIRSELTGTNSSVSNVRSELSGTNSSVADLRTVVSGVIGTDPAVFAGALNSIQEITAYLDGDGNITLVQDLSKEVNRISGSLVAVSGALDAERLASVAAATASYNQAKAALDAAKFSFNGTQISASGGAFKIDGSSNITIGAVSNGTASVSLNDSVTITGKLTAANVEATSEVKGATVVSTAKMTAGAALEVTTGNLQVLAGEISGSGALKAGGTLEAIGAATLRGGLQVTGEISGSGELKAAGAATLGSTLGVAGKVSANAGLDVTGQISGSGALLIGGASTLAGAVEAKNGLTVSAGKLAVEHGTIKAVMVSGVDDLAGAYAASGSSNGQFFYLSGDAAGGFPRGNCWYFCQESLWFDAPFYNG